MANKFLFTRQGDKEDVLHVGDTGTVVYFTGDPGVAETLAEIRKRTGQAAAAREVSADEFVQAREQAEKDQQAFEAAQPKISFEP